LQAAIKQKYGIVADLKEGHSGIFTVEIDDRMAFDNRVTYRFPTDEEIFAAIDAVKA
jgi:hypothetical protein